MSSFYIFISLVLCVNGNLISLRETINLDSVCDSEINVGQRIVCVFQSPGVYTVDRQYLNVERIEFRRFSRSKLLIGNLLPNLELLRVKHTDSSPCQLIQIDQPVNVQINEDPPVKCQPQESTTISTPSRLPNNANTDIVTPTYKGQMTIQPQESTTISTPSRLPNNANTDIVTPTYKGQMTIQTMTSFGDAPETYKPTLSSQTDNSSNPNLTLVNATVTVGVIGGLCLTALIIVCVFYKSKVSKLKKLKFGQLSLTFTNSTRSDRSLLRRNTRSLPTLAEMSMPSPIAAYTPPAKSTRIEHVQIDTDFISRCKRGQSLPTLLEISSLPAPILSSTPQTLQEGSTTATGIELVQVEDSSPISSRTRGQVDLNN